uniref:Uncharacterized protein n=1 Tax=Anguilla anguilla TaxID=7936 RepID=A0A0E9S133_ANGAN
MFTASLLEKTICCDLQWMCEMRKQLPVINPVIKVSSHTICPAQVPNLFSIAAWCVRLENIVLQMYF